MDCNLHNNPFRYRGYYLDAETGLYYLNSRYYDPNTGRFINADGYVSTGSGLLGYNMFAYCYNNPVTYTDANGKIPVWAIITIAFVAVVVVPTVINHIVNANNYSEIDKTIKKEYSSEDAKKEIDDILHKYDETANITFGDTSVKIENSYLVTSRYDRQMICEIIARTAKTDRESDNMSTEWLCHNICYSFGIKRDSSADVDIDCAGDSRFVVRAGTKVLEILGWE